MPEPDRELDGDGPSYVLLQQPWLYLSPPIAL